MNRVVVPPPVFRRALELARRHGAVWLPSELSSRSRGSDLLLRGPITVTDEAASGAGCLLMCSAPFLLAARELARHHQAVGLLVVASDGERAAVELLEPGTELDGVLLVGPGMHWLPLGYSELRRALFAARARADVTGRERWSRTIGAIGSEGAWRRLCQLSFGIVGCGRSGSLFARDLAGLGVKRIDLVDPDLQELHNSGEMVLVRPDDDKSKAVALQERLRETAPWCETAAIVADVRHPDAIKALREVDVLIAAADNEGALLITALLAAAFHKPLVTVATGVRRADDGARRMGADVRLVLPGDPQGPCLLCLGSVRSMFRALEALSAPGRREADFRTERAGSLQSLNALAVSMAILMLTELITERLTGSRWTRLEVDPTSTVAVRYPNAVINPECSLCAKAGLGDQVLAVGTTE